MIDLVKKTELKIEFYRKVLDFIEEILGNPTYKISYETGEITLVENGKIELTEITCVHHIMNQYTGYLKENTIEERELTREKSGIVMPEYKIQTWLDVFQEDIFNYAIEVGIENGVDMDRDRSYFGEGEPDEVDDYVLYMMSNFKWHCCKIHPGEGVEKPLFVKDIVSLVRIMGERDALQDQGRGAGIRGGVDPEETSNNDVPDY